LKKGRVIHEGAGLANGAVTGLGWLGVPGSATAGRRAEAVQSVRAAHGRGEPGPGAEVTGRGEARDVADLGDHQHRDVAPDAADLAEHLDVGVGLGAPVDLGHPGL
jgi:hypothetical protein